MWFLALLLSAAPDVSPVKEAGEMFGARVQTGEVAPYLCAAAQMHSEYQARLCTQGHQRFGERMAGYQREFGQHAYAEICAETWTWQDRDSLRKRWDEMFRCWKQSPGHWAVAVKRHRFWGFGMARGSNGIWYGTILVAD